MDDISYRLQADQLRDLDADIRRALDQIESGSPDEVGRLIVLSLAGYGLVE